MAELFESHEQENISFNPSNANGATIQAINVHFGHGNITSAIDKQRKGNL